MAYTAVKLADVTKAINAVKAAQTKYDAAVKNSGANSTAKTALVAAQKKLDDARAKRDSLQSDFDNQKYLTTDAGYKTANTNLTTAQKALDAARSFIDSNDYLNKNTTYQNALKTVTAKEQARDKAQSALDNATDKNRASLQKAYNAADAAVNAAYKARDTTEQTARTAAEKAANLAQTTYDQKQSLVDKARDTAQATAQKVIDAQDYLINGGNNKTSLDRTFNTAQESYQKILDEIQPDLDARNDAINSVKEYVGNIKDSLGDITNSADANAVKTMLGQISTAVKGTGISDFQGQLDPLISQIDPLKMSNIPTLNAGFKGLSPDVFSNIDRSTGLPLLNQGALDNLLSKYKSNTLDSGQYRDNYNAFGWNSKSDGSSVAHGAAVLGLDYKSSTNGMSPGAATIVKAGTNTAATDADIKKAADQLGIDVNQYYADKKATSGMGVTTTQKVLDKKALYDEINNRTKDLYLVANALEAKGANNPSQHASVLFKADGNGNLVPVTNADGTLAASYYSTPTVSHAGWKGQLAELAPILSIASMVFAPELSGYLQGALGGAEVGATAAIAPTAFTVGAPAAATTLTEVIGATAVKAISNAVVNAGMSAITGGDPLKAALSGAAGTVAAANATSIANNVMGAGDAARGAEVIKQIAEKANLSPAQVEKIIAGGVSTGLTSAVNDPDNAVNNTLASITGNFASAEVKNLITDNFDGSSVAKAANVAGNLANVATQTAVKGGDVGAALQNSLPSIIGGAVKSGTTATTTPAQNQVVSAFDATQPGKVFPELGKVASADGSFEISGVPLLAGQESDLKQELPPGYRLATFDEASSQDLKASQLPNGQYVFIVSGEVPGDSGEITGTAGTGAEKIITTPDTVDTADRPTETDFSFSDFNLGLSGVGGKTNLSGVGSKTGIVGVPLPTKTLPTGETVATADKELPLTETVATAETDNELPLTETVDTFAQDKKPFGSAPGNPKVPLTPKKATGAPTTTFTDPVAAAQAQVDDFSYSKIGDQSQLLNPLLFSLAGFTPKQKINTQSGSATAPFSLLGLGTSAYAPSQDTSTDTTSTAYMYNQPSAAEQFASNPLPSAIPVAANSQVPISASYYDPLSVSQPLSQTQDTTQSQNATQIDDPYSFAQGGLASKHPAGEPQFYSQGGLGNMYVNGDGDGTSDEVPAMLANNEFVIPADVVSALGNGSSEAGAGVLEKFMYEIRKHKQQHDPSDLPPQSRGPLEYLSAAMQKGHRA